MTGDGHTQGYIIVSGNLADGNKRLSIFGVAPDGAVRAQPAVTLTLDSAYLFFDTARIGNIEQLLIGGVDGVFLVDLARGDLRLLMTLPSLFRVGSDEPLRHIDFAFDVNADQLDDLVLPDYDGVRIALQSDSGFGEPQFLRLQPEFRFTEESAQFRPLEIYSFDFNNDSRIDVAARRGREFIVFESVSGASEFAEEPRSYPIDIEITDDETVRRLEDDLLSVDQSDLQLTQIARVEDLNGDGLPDIVTHTTLSDGVFDKRSEYRVHIARSSPGGLYFVREQDSTIAADDFQIGLEIVPAGPANRSDIVTTSVAFGFRQLIASLFSRSLTLDIRLHHLAREGVYSSDPDFTSQAKLRFDLTTGFVSAPAIRFADFDGDGRVDLLTQIDDTGLRFESAISASERNRSNDFEWRTSLPGDGTLIETAEVNGDNRADVLIRYGNGDDENLRRTFRVLISTEPAPPAR